MAEKKQEMKKLYRSRVDRYIGGVSGGLGEYFNMDANLFRILFVVFTFVGGIGLLLYIVALLIIPENPSIEEVAAGKEKDRTVFWALLLIVVGVILLFKEFGIFNYFYFWHIPWSTIWALFLIVIGIVLILSVNKTKKTTENSEESSSAVTGIKQIHRSKNNRMLAGVCAGIADYFRIDPSIVRMLWVLASFASAGLGVLVYIVLIFVFPEEMEAA